jgi:hypothetical protein
MSNARIQISMWILIVICAMIIAVAATGAFVPPIAISLLACGVLGIVLAFLMRGMYVRKNEHARALRDADRDALLERQIESVESVDVEGSSGLALAALVAAVAAIFSVGSYFAFHWGVAAVALFLWPFSVLLVLTALPFVGKPVITITSSGIETPAHGKFTWKEIDGIDLSRVPSRSESPPFVLYFLVPTLPNHVATMHVATRILWRLLRFEKSQNILRVRLANTSESPQIVRQLCVALWTKNTGKKSHWYASMSRDELNRVRADEQRLAMLERAGQLAGSDPNEAAKILDEFERMRNANLTPEQITANEQRRIAFQETAKRHGIAEGLRALAKHGEERKRQMDAMVEQAKERAHLTQRRIGWVIWIGFAAFAVGYLWLAAH